MEEEEEEEAILALLEEEDSLLDALFSNIVAVSPEVNLTNSVKGDDCSGFASQNAASSRRKTKISPFDGALPKRNRGVRDRGGWKGCEDFDRWGGGGGVDGQ